MMKFLLDLLFPRRAVCMGCGSMFGCDRNDICDECREKLSRSWVGVRHAEKKSGLDGTAFAHRYHGVAGNLVRRMKYSSVRVLADEMGSDTARAAQLLRLENVSFVTAVPMHPRRLRARGCNHGEVLAKSAAEKMDLPFEMVLMRTRDSVQQARLSDDARKKNLDGAFAVRPEFDDRMRDAVVLLIDDVYTTGSTAKECASALRKAGAAKVYFAGYAVSQADKRRK